jgi:TRAP-type C4-dicarboxylate transport system permease small subunit
MTLLGGEMRIITKVFLSIVAVGAAFVASVLGFMALPINWRVGSIWVSWSAMLQNGAIAFGFLAASGFALRVIWKPSSKAEANSSGDASHQ